jgi:putative ABC transport system ATP-binding protein
VCDRHGQLPFVHPTLPPTPHSPMLPIISVRKLNHYFGSGSLCKQVLSNINLDIHAGEIVILSGPSGSGKTTLLTLMGGLRAVHEGSLKVFNQELRGIDESQFVSIRRHIGYIFQAHNLLNSLTAQQNVQMSVQLHENIPKLEAQARAKVALQAVGLGDRTHYYPENLSGGQKQRVAIARALVCHPKLVLADEPTAALDSKSGRDVVNLMQRLVKEQGCAVLMVTHDNRVLDIADRILHMEDGQIVTADSEQNVALQTAAAP